MATIGLINMDLPSGDVMFYPVHPQQGKVPALWKTRESTSIAAVQLTHRVMEDAKRTLVTSKIALPVMEIVPEGCCTTDIPKAAFQNLVVLDMQFPLKSGRTDRVKSLEIFRAFVNSALFESAVLDFEQVW